MTDARAGLLRLAMGLAIVFAMAAAGFLNRSPWIILIATPAFTLLYALGKWDAWRLAFHSGGAGRIALAVLTTLPIQAIVAGVFYLIGLGVGKLASAGAPLAALSAGDVFAVLGLTGLAALVSIAIIRIERQAPVARPCFPTIPENASDDDAIQPEPEPELDIDPVPLTLATFFLSPPYSRPNAAQTALESRSAKRVEKKPLAAREDMIAAAEERLGVGLPDTLKALYRKLNGGYVGALYVPLKPTPRPVFDDWRGAFSIDYSSLATLEQLRTVKTHYEDWTDDPEDFPENADRLIVLQARYGDMTLLDYSQGPAPRVLLVDYDKNFDRPVDAAFDDFDQFFAALRRERPWRPPGGWGSGHDLSPPLAAFPQAERGPRFWGKGLPHFCYANAKSREAPFTPKLEADDALVAETEARLGLKLPAMLVALWRVKNGSGVSHRYLEAPPLPDGRPNAFETMRRPYPLEYLVTLAELSDRIAFPPGETPWRDRHPDAEKLLVLEADHGRAVLLDYRAGGEPAVLVVADLDSDALSGARRFESFEALVDQLRSARRGHDDVSIRYDA